MISAGNDIVALSRINRERTKQFNFYSKILATSEQDLYHSPSVACLTFENYVWMLWSVKESAFKYLKRIIHDLIFSPTKIVANHIQLSQIPAAPDLQAGFNDTGPLKLFNGRVTIGEYILYFTSKISADWIASVVSDTENFENICWEVAPIADDGYNYQSKAAREHLINKLNTHFSPGFQVDKNPAGFPEIFKNNLPVNIPVSLAHDGFFISYSFRCG